MADEKTPPQHTPTPWECSDMGDAWTIFKSGTNWFLAEMSTLNPEANAAFVVKAVNCHDELVAALRFCYATLSNVVHTEKRLRIEVDGFYQGERFEWPQSTSALAKADASVEDVGER